MSVRMPKNVVVGDVPMKFTFVRIHSRFEDGEPETLQVVRKNQPFELSSNKEFNCVLTAYIPDVDYSKHAGQIPTISE